MSNSSPTRSRIESLVLEWDDSRAAGRQLSVETLCADCPELVNAVRSRIQILESTDWMDETMGSADFASGTVEAGRRTVSLSDDGTDLPRSRLTLPDFLTAITVSGLLNDDQLATLEEVSVEQDPRQLGIQLVADAVLTPYQATSVTADPVLCG